MSNPIGLDGGVLALIPARGGSKRLPSKNLQLCGGRSLIAHAIECAQAVRPQVSYIAVSTDSDEIAAAARHAGATVPFMRPAALATDETSSLDVVSHALDWFEAAGKPVRWVLLLQPTSPLRRKEDVEAALALAAQTDCDSVVSVVTLQHEHPRLARRIEQGRLVPFYDPGQSLPDTPAYANNGAIYLTRASVIREQKSLYGKFCHAYVMPRERSLDIDTAFDLQIASMLLGKPPIRRGVP